MEKDDGIDLWKNWSQCGSRATSHTTGIKWPCSFPALECFTVSPSVADADSLCREAPRCVADKYALHCMYCSIVQYSYINIWGTCSTCYQFIITYIYLIIVELFDNVCIFLCTVVSQTLLNLHLKFRMAIVDGISKEWGFIRTPAIILWIAQGKLT